MPQPAPTGGGMPVATASVAPQDHSALVIGNVGSYRSGGGQGSDSTYPHALAAWVAHVNAGGGIAGHPVRLKVEDDQGDPAQHAVLMNSLVNAGVVAIVGDRGQEGQDATLLKGTGVPLIGGPPGTQEQLDGNPDFLPSGTSPEALTFGYLTEAKRAGGDRLALMSCVEASSCQTEHDRVTKQGYAAAAGLTVVADQTTSITQPDFTSECLRMKNAQADTVLVVTDPSTTQRILTSCNRQGATWRWLIPSSSIPTGAPSLPDGTISDVPGAPWFVSSSAATLERKQVLTAANVAVAEESAEAWNALELFRVVTEHALTAGPVTRASLRAAAGQLREETLGGLAPPLSGGGAAAAPKSRCWFPLTVAHGSWTAPLGTGDRCGSKP